MSPKRKEKEPPVRINGLTDVIQHPQQAWEEIERLRSRHLLFEQTPEPTRYPLTYCDVIAPPSKACSLGKQCKCVQLAGHTTPHRAKCGSRWANRKRDKV